MSDQGEFDFSPWRARKPKTFSQARRERDEAIERVDEHADDEWKEVALDCVRQLCRQHALFTSDEVLELLETKPVTTHDTRALGPVMLKAVRDGLIEKSGRLLPSRRRHMAPIFEWRSLIHPAKNVIYGPEK